MTAAPPLIPHPPRHQTLGEEIANSLSHGLGAVAALVGGILLIVTAAQRGDAAFIVGSSIFAATVLLLYTVSAVYHAMPHSRFKRIFRALDHTSIYLLIAGTYTPFTLGVLRGPWGWTLLGLIWSLALAGVLLKMIGWLGYGHRSLYLYLAMGWLALIAAQPLWTHVPGPGLLWLLAGGIAYTAGVIFYASDHRVRYHHFIWHLFTLAGTTCHFLAVLWYAA